MKKTKKALVQDAVSEWYVECLGPNPILNPSGFADYLLEENIVPGPKPSVARYVREATEEATSRACEFDRYKRDVADAFRWRNFEASILENLGGPPPKPWPREIDSRAIGSRCLVYSPSDLHVGKLSDDYNSDVAERRLRNATLDIMSRVEALGGVDEIVLVLGNDWLHVDSAARTTTRGTPQDSEFYKKIVPKSIELAAGLIQTLQEHAFVKVVTITSNHCHTGDVWMPYVLSAHFRENPNVEVIDSVSRGYIEFGENMFAFEHGDGPPANKLAKIAAAEARDVWGRTTWCTWFVGHLHHLKEWDDGCMIYQMPSLSGTDRWHHKNGYVTARKAAVAYAFDSEKGEIARFMSIAE